MSATIQQVNLFLPELRPRHDWLSARRMLQLCALTLLLMTLLAAWSTWQRSSARAELTLTQEQLQEQTQRTQQFERDVAGRATDQALLREMNQREMQVSQSRQLFDFMSTTTLGNLKGYSEHLMDLSRASFPGIWLTQFDIRGDASYVMIRGSAQQAAMMPDFVGRLGNGRSEISDKRFSRLATSRGESAGASDVYEFILETNQ